MDSPLRVLFVDDKNEIIQPCLAELEKQKITVEHDVLSTEKKIDPFLKNNNWTLIIANQNYSKLNPLRILEYATTHSVICPIILITDNISVDEAITFWNSGVNDMIDRANLSNLIPVITRELNKESKRVSRTEMQLQFMMNAIEQSAAAIVVMNKQGRFTYTNKKFTEMTGYSREEVYGKNHDVLRSGEMPAEFYRELWETLHSGNEWIGELRNKKKSGEHYWEENLLSPIKDKKGKITHFVGIKRDITRYRKSEEEKMGFENELNRQFHLSQVGLLMTGIIHNLRTPLSLIMMNASFLQRQADNVLSEAPEDPFEYAEILESFLQRLSKIQNGADRLQNMLEDINSYILMNQHPESESVDLNVVIMADAAILKADLDIKHRINMQLSLSPGELWVDTHPSEIGLIFLNLVSNAADALLDCETRELTVKSGISDDESSVWLEVHDTGHGIPDDIRQQMMEPFFSTRTDDEEAKRRGSGTGLGLYMVGRILSKRNGFIRVESSPGDTSVRIYLPQSEK